MNNRSRKFAASAAAAVLGAVMMSGCSAPGGNVGNAPGAAPGDALDLKTVIGTAAQSQGPAPAIGGAHAGGTVTVLDSTDYMHLDPQKVYAMDGGYDIEDLIVRRLTNYTVVNGVRVLVGDMATDTGEPSDGNRVWTFHLKPGLTWQDGSPVTSAQVAYGIERSFEPGFEDGPVYWQTWLTGTASITAAQKVYAGPGQGQMKQIQTPDAGTIVFTFPQPESDVPFIASLGTASAVPRAQDTGADYDLKPFSNGPYEIASHVENNSLKLVRNPYWHADTDPIRYQFATGYDFSFGDSTQEIGEQMLAASGVGTTTMTTGMTLDPSLYTKVAALKNKSRVLYSGSEEYAYWFAINDSLITDVNLRKALLYAFPKQQLRQAQGGDFAGDYATTISTPNLLGFQNYNEFPQAGLTGNVALAKQYLAKSKQKISTLVYGYATGGGAAAAAQVQILTDAYAQLGIKVVGKPIDVQTYYDDISAGNSPYDLYLTGFGADWPSTSTMLEYIFDDREGWYYDSSKFDSGPYNAEFDAAAAMPTAQAKADAFAKLEQQIMQQAPVIPYVYSAGAQIHGSSLVLPEAAYSNPLDGAYIS